MLYKGAEENIDFNIIFCVTNIDYNIFDTPNFNQNTYVYFALHDCVLGDFWKKKRLVRKSCIPIKKTSINIWKMYSVSSRWGTKFLLAKWVDEVAWD